MPTPPVSVIILTYNAQKYIKKCLDSVLAQTYPNIEVIAIDNNSSDETKKLISNISALGGKYPMPFRIILNKSNTGFAAGQNQGIRMSRGKYVLCLNQDAWLDKDYIGNAIAVLEKNKKAASVQGKLMRFDFQNNKILDIMDTTGLVMLKNRRIINRDQGTPCRPGEKKDQNKIEEIFGPDGAAPVYRRTALEDIKLPRTEKKGIGENNSIEYFDEDFFIYKEDVDLAWRLRLYGWKNLFVEQCVAYHGRGAGDSAALSSLEIIKERRKISPLAKYYSWKNQRLMQIKNETPGVFLKHLPWFLPKEIASWIYILIFEEPQAIKSIVQMFLQLPIAFRKRKIIMSKKRAKDKSMAQWFQ